MAKQGEDVAEFLTTCHSPLSTVEILREAMKLPSRNGRFMFHLILLLLFPFSLLLFLHNLLAKPLINKVEDSYEQSPPHLTDHVRSLVCIELPLFLAFSIVSFVGIMLTIHASASTYIGKYIGLNDLILRIIKLSWKNPLITWLYVCFLATLYIIVSSLLIKLVYAVSSHYHWISWVVGIAAAVSFLYVAAQWSLAFVISVMEDDYYGRKAVERAGKLMAGRELQGFFLMMILVAITCPIHVVFYVILTDDDDEVGLLTQFAFGLIALMFFFLSKMFIAGVFTIFCYECKLSYENKVEVELDHV